MQTKITLKQAIQRAYRAMQAKDIPLVSKLAHQIYHAHPEQAEALQLMGLFYNLLGSGVASMAIHFLDQAKARGLKTLSVLLPLAQAYLDLGQFAKAHEELDLAQSILPTTEQIHIVLLRGKVFMAELQWESASRIFEALQAVPEYRDLATGWLAFIACARGQFHQANTLFAQLDLASAHVSDSTRKVFERSAKDAQANLLPATTAHKILTLRHASKDPDFYQVFLDWVRQNAPDYLSLFELRLLPCGPINPESYALFLPWLQDPVQNWSQLAYKQARQIEVDFKTHNKPVINPVSALHQACKLEGSHRMAQAGLPVPRMVKLQDLASFKQDLGGLNLPLFIREDWGHGSLMIRIDTPDDLKQVNLDAYLRPIATEIIDVRSPDGLYRKYRYYAIGTYGISHHLFAQPHWITRGDQRIFSPQIQAEELAYIAHQDPHHEAFQKARIALGLDFVAFDYGYDTQGQLIVWEANPYPFVRWPSVNGQSEYRVAALHRTMAAMLVFYLEKAGLSAPDELKAIAMYHPQGEAALAKMRRPE